MDELRSGARGGAVPDPHWEEADGPTECTFVHNQDFKAFLWEAFMPTAAYSDWLLETDMTGAYEYERLVLQVLQSPPRDVVAEDAVPRRPHRGTSGGVPGRTHRLGAP